MIACLELLLAVLAVRASYDITGGFSLVAFGLSVMMLILAIIDVGALI